MCTSLIANFNIFYMENFVFRQSNNECGSALTNHPTIGINNLIIIKKGACEDIGKNECIKGNNR